MNTPASSPTSRLIQRRTFLASCGASAATASAARAATLPVGGLFAASGGRIRVGVIGCGGRGTGAALQAAHADAAVAVTCLGDLFADQVASSADVLAARAGRQFDCPPDRRFSGADAWRAVLATDVDLVILAGPPHTRPLHLAATVGSGRHVFCETPAAIDPSGVDVVRTAAAEAQQRGLSFVSGLPWRHHAATREAIARLHGGEIGRLLQVDSRAFIGLPWRKPSQHTWSPAESRLRNWISFADLSGGHLVEHHMHALDKAMWILGPDLPVRAVPIGPRAGAAAPDTTCRPTTAVRFDYADGRSITAVIDRRPRGRSRIEEIVRGSDGTAALPPLGRRDGGQEPDPCQAAMDTLVAAVLSGTRADDSAHLCASSLVAVMGRSAVDSGAAVDRDDMQPAGLASRQAVQSIRS